MAPKVMKTVRLPSESAERTAMPNVPAKPPIKGMRAQTSAERWLAAKPGPMTPAQKSTKR